MIELLLNQRPRRLGSFEVGRVLPAAKRRMIGPFIFFDHMGPVDLPKGLPRNADVIHAIQSWVALPNGQEEAAPAFAHHEGNDLPVHRMVAYGCVYWQVKRSV